MRPTLRAIPPARAPSGVALITCLMLLGGVMVLGATAANLSLQGERAARLDRDRQLAFQSAEAALRDAEIDIQESPDAAQSRSMIFGSDKTEGFATDCNAGDNNRYQGLCLPAMDLTHPVWLTADLLDESAATAPGVLYGRFTGQRYPGSSSLLPSRAPRYLIELLPYARPGNSADDRGGGIGASGGGGSDSEAGVEARDGGRSGIYRITAIGFGKAGSTRVVLQAYYRKE